jgi:hypothetical protein
MKARDDDMKVGDFGKSPHGELFTIAVALAAGAIALYLRTDPNMPNGFHTVMLLMVLLAGSFILLGIILYRSHMNRVQREIAENRKLRRDREGLHEVPKLTGHWTYEVKGTDLTVRQKMHSGECDIEPDDAGPRSFKIYGTRRKTWQLGDTEMIDCDLDWHSIWCGYTDDGEVRLVYAINIDNKRYEGYATLKNVQGKGKELRGDYSLHGPIGEPLTRGTIIFTKTKK